MEYIIEETTIAERELLDSAGIEWHFDWDSNDIVIEDEQEYEQALDLLGR